MLVSAGWSLGAIMLLRLSGRRRGRKPPSCSCASHDEEEGFSSMDEVDKELRGGVREALADLKAAIGRHF